MVNGNYAIEADLKPAEDALVLEKAKDNPNSNLLAVKEGQEDDPRVKKLAKLLTSPEVKKFIEDTYSGSVLPPSDPPHRTATPATGSDSAPLGDGEDPVVRSGAFMLHAGQFSSTRRSLRLRSHV